MATLRIYGNIGDSRGGDGLSITAWTTLNSISLMSHFRSLLQPVGWEAVLPDDDACGRVSRPSVQSP